jgi:chorismate dehydratase
MALDEGSKTSIALMRVIFEENNWKLDETKSFPMDCNPHDIHSDAVLLIGDRAMASNIPGCPFKMDLGEEWKRLTGLPFVFALWAVRPGLKLSAMEIKAFHEALDLGKRNIRNIATRESALLGKDPDRCFLYLKNNIKFDLGPVELKALTLFQTKLVEMGLIKGRNFHEVDQLDS